MAKMGRPCGGEDAGTTIMSKGGRPSEYSHKVADAICERLADGESLRSICREETMPSKATVFRWLGIHREFQDQYARARDEQAECFADELVDIADEQTTMVRADRHGTKADDDDGNTEVVFDPTAVARNRLRIDTRKWVASKLKPKKYGEKVDLTGHLTLEQLIVGQGPKEPAE